MVQYYSKLFSVRLIWFSLYHDLTWAVRYHNARKLMRSTSFYVFMRDAFGSMLSSGSTDQRAHLARAKRVRRAQNCAKKRCKTRDFASKNSKQRSVAVFEEFGQKKRVVLMFFTLIAACFEILVR